MTDYIINTFLIKFSFLCLLVCCSCFHMIQLAWICLLACPCFFLFLRKQWDQQRVVDLANFLDPTSSVPRGSIGTVRERNPYGVAPLHHVPNSSSVYGRCSSIIVQLMFLSVTLLKLSPYGGCFPGLFRSVLFELSKKMAISIFFK